MTIQTLIMFVLSTVGMTHIIVDGSIFESFRNLIKETAKFLKMPKLGSVVDCYLCCGTWCGFFMGLVWISQDPFKIFACGCAGGFLANFATVLLNWVEASTLVNLPDDGHAP